MDQQLQRMVVFFAGLISILALFIEFQTPRMKFGGNFARKVLKEKNLSEDLEGQFCHNMFLHATLRSFCFLFLGVVLTFGIGYLQRGGIHWVSAQSTAHQQPIGGNVTPP
jgi:hypothetical protein